MATVLWSAPYHVGCTYTALPVMLRLRDRGHHVVMQSVPAEESTFRDFGFGFIANRRFPAYDFGEPGAVPDGASGASASREESYQRWWRKLVRLQMADTLELLGEDRYDLVFGGSCMQLCGHGLAAERAGVPWVSYIDFLVDETEVREPEFPAAWDQWRAGLGLPREPRPAAESFWFPFSPHLILYLVHPGLAFGPAPAYVQRVGASMWDAPTSCAPPAWLADLGTQRQAVLLSTSTLWQDDAGLVTAVASGLADDDVDVIATVAAGHELPTLPDNVIVTGHFPHSLILPRVQCVVCSGGLGTVTRGLCAGIPAVVVPRSGDAHHVARAVVRHGAGVAIPAARLTPETIAAAIRRALSDGAMRGAAAAFKGEPVTSEALDAAADSVEALLR